MVMFHTGHLLHSPERVCLNSCPKWKHLEGSFRTTTEGLLENSLSASWNKTSCYLNHQWARQLFVMTVGFKACQVPDLAHPGQEEAGPMLPCRFSESSSDAEGTSPPLLWLGTEVNYSGPLLYLIVYVQIFLQGQLQT